MIMVLTDQRSWRFLFLVSALLVGLWLAGSASAGPQAGRELGLASAPSFAAHLSAGSSIASPADTPTAVLVAHMTWQGIAQPSSRNSTMTLTLTLRLVDGGPLITYPNLTTDASGFLTVPVESLPAGTYNYRAKGYKNLARGGQVGLAGDPVTNVEMGTMPAGDAVENNLVDAIDFSLLRNQFGHCEQCLRDSRCDFNNDDVINATDFTLMKGNFGLGGAPPVSP